jgi:hypothetical protein
MRSVIKKSVVLAGACLVLVGTAANAGAATFLDVKVPFAFVLNGKTFPAGEYTVAQDNMSPAVLSIRGENGAHAGSFVLTEPADGLDPAGSAPALGFTRYEKEYRLSSIWRSGSQGFEIVKR